MLDGLRDFMTAVDASRLPEPADGPVEDEQSSDLLEKPGKVKWNRAESFGGREMAIRPYRPLRLLRGYECIVLQLLQWIGRRARYDFIVLKLLE